MTTPGRNEPQTLKDAHAVASDRRPKPDSNLSAWLKFHQANARMYRAVSDVDRGHHHELRYCDALLFTGERAGNPAGDQRC